MIYIDKDSEKVDFPRFDELSVYDSTITYTVVISSHTSGDLTLIDNERNVSDNPLYYTFPINEFPVGLTTGEYEYTLFANDCSLDAGLLNFGNYQRTDVVVNNPSKNNRIQYNGRD